MSWTPTTTPPPLDAPREPFEPHRSRVVLCSMIYGHERSYTLAYLRSGAYFEEDAPDTWISACSEGWTLDARDITAWQFPEDHPPL